MRRAIMVITAMLASLVTFAVGADVALAHHSEISASVDCANTISWTATSWSTGDSGTNNKVKVWYTTSSSSTQVTLTDTGKFNASNSYKFSGTLAWPGSVTSVTIWVQEQVKWGANQNLAGPAGAASITVKKPTTCPGTPQPPTSTVTCASATSATVVVRFGSSAGGSSSAYAITSPTTNVSPSSFTIAAAGGTRDVTFSNVGNGNLTVKYKINNVQKTDYVVPVDCSPKPQVTFTTRCANAKGEVQISFTNSGKTSVTLTVYIDGAAQSPTVVVPAGTTTPITKTYSGLSNNTTHTIEVKNGSTSVGSTTYKPECAPANPAVSFDKVCSNSSGSVTISFTNDGNAAVTLDVYIDGVKQTPGVSVPARTTTAITKTYGGLSNNTTHTIEVKNGSTSVGSTTYKPECAPGTPVVTFTPVCSNSLGSVTISFTNSGNQAVSLDVFVDGAKNETVNVPALTTTAITKTYGGLSNTTHTIEVKNGSNLVGSTTYKPECAPANPAVTFTPVCANSLGSVTIGFTNSGNAAVTLDVYIDNAKVDSIAVPGLTSTGLTRTYGNLANDPSHTIEVRNGSTVVGSATYDPECAPGTGTATAVAVCANFDGTVTLTLTNTGGDLPVVFVVDGITYTINKGDAPVQLTFNDVPDGTFAKTVTINGVDQVVTADVHCDAVLTALPECNEVDVDNNITAYIATITNPGATPVPVTWADGSGIVPAGGSLRIRSATTPIVVRNGDVTAATVAASSEYCGTPVDFTKQLKGQPAAAETYSVKVSRLVGAEYVEAITFTINAGETKQFKLPSTVDGPGVTYKVEEINAGSASLRTVSPDSFTLSGNLGETVSVVITNGYASVDIVKQVSATTVLPGQVLTYTLTATNTGGLTLNPAVITDILPPQVSMQSALVADGKGTCVLSRDTRPELVTCTLAAPLAPGAVAPVITIVTLVDAGVPANTVLVNQAKVVGAFTEPPSTITEPGIESLSCLPAIDATVCDLSAAVNTTVGEQSESLPPDTPATTQPPAPTMPPDSRLPETGSSGTLPMGGIALILIGLGGVAFVIRRRPA
ncbi:MAG TPA: LPXTG cell wall anchor domain-containing protein, partial [Ilumatobacteraceae bacterium]|nr:LPXTG cell wall anchor domain-containing protein [Ilumatobacteraceae bacterium]